MLNEVKHLVGWGRHPRFFAGAQNDICSGFLIHHTSSFCTQEEEPGVY